MSNKVCVIVSLFIGFVFGVFIHEQSISLIDSNDVFSKYISSLTILGTAMMSFMIWKKSYIHQKFIEKQLDSIFNNANKSIENPLFLIPNKISEQHIPIGLTLMYSSRDDHKAYRNWQVYIAHDSEYPPSLPFNKIVLQAIKDPFFPRIFVKYLKKIDFNTMKKINKDGLPEEYMVTAVFEDGVFNSNDILKRQLWEVRNVEGEVLTVGSLLQANEDLRKEANLWLKKNKIDEESIFL